MGGTDLVSLSFRDQSFRPGVMELMPTTGGRFLFLPCTLPWPGTSGECPPVRQSRAPSGITDVALVVSRILRQSGLGCQATGAPVLGSET